MDSSRKATVSKKDTVQVKAKDAPRHQAKGKKPFTSLSAAASARVKSGKGGVFKYTHEELLKVQEVVAASPLPPPPAGIPAEVRRRQNRDFSAAMWHPIAETKRIHAKTEEVKESLRGEGKPKLMPSPTPKETAKAERLLSREAENEDKQVFDEIFRDVVMNEEKKKTASPKPPPPPLEALDDEDEDDELLDDETSHPAQEASASAMATPVKSGARDLTKPPELLPATAEMLTPSRVVAQSPAHCTPHTRQSLSPQMSPAGSVREMQNVSPAAATPSPSPVPVSMLSAKHPARSQSSSVGYNSSMTPPSSAVRSSVSPLPMSAHAASVSPKPTPGSTIAARQMMYQGYVIRDRNTGIDEPPLHSAPVVIRRSSDAAAVDGTSADGAHPRQACRHAADEAAQGAAGAAAAGAGGAAPLHAGTAAEPPDGVRTPPWDGHACWVRTRAPTHDVIRPSAPTLSLLFSSLSHPLFPCRRHDSYSFPRKL